MGLLEASLAFALWLASLVMPVATLVLAWKVAPKLRRGWVVHVLFLPVVISLEALLMSLLFEVLGSGGDGPPGLYLAALLGVPSTALALLVYYLHLVVRSVETAIHTARLRRRQADI